MAGGSMAPGRVAAADSATRRPPPRPAGLLLYKMRERKSDRAVAVAVLAFGAAVRAPPAPPAPRAAPTVHRKPAPRRGAARGWRGLTMARGPWQVGALSLAVQVKAVVDAR